MTTVLRPARLPVTHSVPRSVQLRVVALLTACLRPGCCHRSLLSPVTNRCPLCLSPGVGPCFLLLETAHYMASVSASRSCHGHTNRPSAAAADLGATRAPDSLLHSLSVSPGTGHRFPVFQRLFAEYLLGVRQLGAGTKQEDKLLAWGISVLVRETIPAAYVVPRGCSEGPQASIRSCNLPLCPPCSGKLLPQLPPATYTHLLGHLGLL